MIKNKQFHPKHAIGSVVRKYHFSNPNTAEILFSLLFIGLIYKTLSLLERTR